jgi:cytochrome c
MRQHRLKNNRLHWLKFLCMSLAIQAVTIQSVNASTQSDKSALELARQHNCLSCHAPNKKLIGPSFKDIATRYRDNPSAPKYLHSRARNGGSGVWGVVAMPANKKISDADLEKIIHWVLNQN